MTTDDGREIDETEADEGDVPEGRSILRTMVGAGALGLALVGALLLGLSLPLVLDPSGVRCDISRAVIDEANEDDESFNDVDLDGDASTDLDCDDAVRTASTIRTEEGDESATVEVPSESDIRTRGLVNVVIGLVQSAAGVAVLVTRRRLAGHVALGAALLGILVPALGLISIAVTAFAVYALGFSASRRELWGRLSWAGGSRRSRRE